MYNRYIPNGASYTRVIEEDTPSGQSPPQPSSREAPPKKAGEKKAAGALSGLLRSLKLDKRDTGDILLLLILLFLFLEGDDTELLITLGLLLLLGLE